MKRNEMTLIRAGAWLHRQFISTAYIVPEAMYKRLKELEDIMAKGDVSIRDCQAWVEAGGHDGIEPIHGPPIPPEGPPMVLVVEGGSISPAAAQSLEAFMEGAGGDMSEVIGRDERIAQELKEAIGPPEAPDRPFDPEASVDAAHPLDAELDAWEYDGQNWKRRDFIPIDIGGLIRTDNPQGDRKPPVLRPVEATPAMGDDKAQRDGKDLYQGFLIGAIVSSVLWFLITTIL